MNMTFIQPREILILNRFIQRILSLCRYALFKDFFSLHIEIMY